MLETRASLLFRIRDPKDALAWTQFVHLYAPLLHSYGMKNGLQDADAADLAQETLRNVLRAAPEFVYNPHIGSFRGWLFTVARNEIRKFATRKSNRNRGTGDSDVQQMIANLPAQAPDAGEWDREYQLNLFHWAAQRVKIEYHDKTWQAFWQTVVDARAVEEVARELEMTAGAIYIARSRVTARIRKEIQTVEGGEA